MTHLHVSPFSVLCHGRIQCVHYASVWSRHMSLCCSLRLFHYRLVQLHQWVSKIVSVFFFLNCSNNLKQLLCNIETVIVGIVTNSLEKTRINAGLVSQRPLTILNCDPSFFDITQPRWHTIYSMQIGYFN